MGTANKDNHIPWDEIENVFFEVWEVESNSITKWQLKEIEAVIEGKDPESFNPQPFEASYLVEPIVDWAAIQTAFAILNTLITLILPIMQMRKSSSFRKNDIKNCIVQLLKEDDEVKEVIKLDKVDKITETINSIITSHANHTKNHPNNRPPHRSKRL